ncbi:MAG: nitrous oxide reductase family maturation protein NosD [Polyangiaceae bacterium]|nr:nitrous oxide reductase family maturation protein NosD [Polyangiaceae bacterium]
MTRSSGARMAALSLFALALGAAPAQGDTRATVAPGPRAGQVPAGAVVARSFEELQALVSDPAGPATISVSGTLRGDLVVRRPVAIVGQPGAALEGTGTGTVLRIDAKDVRVEDLVVRRSGHRHTTEDAGVHATGERVHLRRLRVEETLFGISLAACKSCGIEGAHVVGYADDTELRGDGVKLWESDDSVVRDSLLERSRDLVVWYTKRALLVGNTVRHSRYGSHFMYAHDAVVRDSRMESNVVGVFVMYSMRVKIEHNVLAGARGAAGIGLGFKDSDAVEVKGNWLVANTAGAYFDNTPRVTNQPVHFDDNVVALNEVGLRLHGYEDGLHVRRNDFRENAVLVEVDGGGDAHKVGVRGNHYSDYEGYDLDRDGVGDVAYEMKTLSRDLTDARPALKYFQGTAAMGVIDAVAHAVPVFAARRLWVDPAPAFGRLHQEAP